MHESTLLLLFSIAYAGIVYLTLSNQFHSQGLAQIFGTVFGIVRCHCLPDDSKPDLMSLHTQFYSQGLAQLFWYCFQYHTLTLPPRQIDGS